MRYAEYAPSPRFARFVDTYWILEGEGTGLPEAILPDGRLEIIFHYGATFSHHRADGVIDRQPSTLLAGQALAPVVLSYQGCAGVAAIRLRPAAAGAVLRFPVSETTGRIQDLEAVFPSARALRDRLGEARDDQERIEELESWLDERALAEPLPEVDAGVAAILDSNGRADIATLASRMGIGVRRLERRFADHVGLSPKQFARIVRLQRALRLVRSGGALADVALACGYYDQSHMVLDFQQLAAVSPRAWREHAGELAPLFAGCDSEPNPSR